MNNMLFLNFGGLDGFIFALILFIPLGLWLWALIDLLKSNFTNQTNKLVWLILIVFLPILGVPLYFFLAERQKA